MDFLNAFWSDGVGHFRQFNDREVGGGRNFHGTFNDCLSEMAANMSAGFGTFFLPNRGGTKDEHITEFNAVFIDVDASKGDPIPQSYHIDPSIITQRGNNYHMYWLLQPGTITDGDTFKAVQKSLAKYYKSDEKIINPSRVMRLPYTPYFKDDTGVNYTLFHFDPNTRYTRDQVMTGIIPVTVQKTEIRNRENDRYEDTAFAISLATKRIQKTPGGVEGENGNDAGYQLCAYLNEVGLTEETAYQLLAEHWNPRCEPPFSENELRTLVRNGRNHAQKSGGDAVKVLQSFNVPEGVTPEIVETITDAELIAGKMEFALGKLAIEIMGDQAAPLMTVNREVIKNIISSCYLDPVKQRYHILKNDTHFNNYTPQQAATAIVAQFGHPAPCVNELMKVIDTLGKSKTEVKDFSKRLVDTWWNNLNDFIVQERQANKISFEVDLFSEKADMIIKAGTVKCVLPFPKFHTEHQIENVDQKIVDEYLTHFPEFHDVLEFIIASRLSPVRKTGHLWMRCASDWGKGVFGNFFAKLSAIQDMDKFKAAVSDIDVSDLTEIVKQRPTGRSEADFIYAITLFADEFSKVTKELKKIDEGVSINVKNCPVMRVPLYSKIYFSANDVPSLRTPDGIEAQFSNRFSYIRRQGSINNLTYRKQKGKNYFDNHMRQYVCNYLNKRFKEYKALGLEQCHNAALAQVDKFHGTYGIEKIFGTINDNIVNLADDFIAFCCNPPGSIAPKVREHARYDPQKGKWFVSCPSKVCNMWVDHTDGIGANMTKRKIQSEILDQIDGGPKTQRPSDPELFGRVNFTGLSFQGPPPVNVTPFSIVR